MPVKGIDCRAPGFLFPVASSPSLSAALARDPPAGEKTATIVYLEYNALIGEFHLDWLPTIRSCEGLQSGKRGSSHCDAVAYGDLC